MTITIPGILKYHAFTHPLRIAYVYDNENTTYRDYYIRAQQTAAYLLSLNLKRGDRIAILDFNNAQVINLITGAMMAGIIPVSLNWRSTPAEVAYIINDASIQHLFFGAAFATLVSYAPLPQSVDQIDIMHINTVISSFEAAADVEMLSGNDVCIVLYTSGTTGKPKGVLLTYQNLYTCYAISMSETPSSGPDSKILVCGPLFSIFGFGVFFTSLYVGATSVFIKMFDPAAVCAAIVNYKITHTLLIPVMMRMMLGVAGIETMDFSSVKHIQYGGSPISPDVLVMMHKFFQCDFTQAYGLTETTGISCYLRFDDHRRLLAEGDVRTNAIIRSAGKPAAGVAMKIMTDAGTEAAVSERGEVWLKGENIAKGYWNNPGETAGTFSEDGWFKTGDIGYLDAAGYLFLADRKNDMIISKGFNIYPAEVESVLQLHPAVKEVAVIGVPDDLAGEAVCAFVVLKGDEELSLEELRTWSIDKISRNKIPKRLEITKELPRNQTGKVLRRILREPFWAGEERNIKG